MVGDRGGRLGFMSKRDPVHAALDLAFGFGCLGVVTGFCVLSSMMVWAWLNLAIEWWMR